jgi:hypothetical protein
VARGSTRNAHCCGRVVAGPEHVRHQRRRCPDGDRHRRRGPRRQPRASGPAGGGGSFDQSSAGGDRKPGRVGAAIRVLHGSALNSANVVPRAADLYTVPVAVKNDVPDAERVYLRAEGNADSVYLRADAHDERIHANAYPERVYLHADAHDEPIHARADAERVYLGYRGANAHCFGVGLGVAHGVVDSSAVGVSRDLAPRLAASRPRAIPSG